MATRSCPGPAAAPLSAGAATASLRARVAAAAALPGWCYWIAGLLIYGYAAWHFSGGHLLHQTSRDYWQHLAALRALIDNPVDPANPFIATGDGSRHFHPYWVSIAAVARNFGWNEFQALALGGYLTAGALLAGIWAFGRSFYRHRWGPLALLAALVLSWSLPISHTGYHSVETLIEGFGYPAVLLVALSLLLWALVLKALERPALAALAVPLVAFMFATHQLGAGLGLIAAGCFILLSPRGTIGARVLIGGAIGAGLLLSCAWPYFNPLMLVVRAGNPSWSGGIDFYHPVLLITAAVPSLVGLVGLRHPRFRADARPVLAAFAAFAFIFALGLAGPPIATRFVMPAVLMLQIGVGALLIALWSDWQSLPRRAQLGWFALGAATVIVHLNMAYVSLKTEYRQFRAQGSAYAAAAALTADIPDREAVAALDVAVWPMVATGQRALSVPWPEPGIADLATRQAATGRLFDPALSRPERVALAARWGVRSLVLDRRGPLRQKMPPRLLATLTEQSLRRRAAGQLIRFDLR